MYCIDIGHVLLSIMHQELFLTENDHFHAMFITNYNWLKIICCQFVMKKKDFFIILFVY